MSSNEMSNLDVAKFLISNNVQKVVELIADAQEHKEEGQKDLANFIYSKPSKKL